MSEMPSSAAISIRDATSVSLRARTDSSLKSKWSPLVAARESDGAVSALYLPVSQPPLSGLQTSTPMQ